MSAYKPKIYRSQDGCCICKAKSSSSRFTDGGKYEEDCQSCFLLPQRRCGEMCNACVLIVKRWKKLPRNTAKNWAHVVDARVGPGTKNIFKQKKKEVPAVAQCEKFKHKHVYKRRKTTKARDSGGHLSDSAASTRSESPVVPAASQNFFPTPTFLDNSYWSQQMVCCGLVYLGQLGEVMLDQQLYRPCTSTNHTATHQPAVPSRDDAHQPHGSHESTFASSLNPSSIESLVEAELQAFQLQSIDPETEDEEFYADAHKMTKRHEVNSSNDFEGDEGFCDRLDQKTVFPASIGLIATH